MKRKIQLGALLLAFILLAGCGEQPAEIFTLELPTASPGQGATGTQGQEADYISPGYYAPNAVMSPDAPVVPAPASIEEIREAAQQHMMDEDYEAASEFTTIAKGDLNIGIVASADMLISPLRCKYLDMMNLNTLVFEGLVKLDANRMPVPELADLWSQSGDTWEFTVRSNVYFHDGTILSAQDVAASYNDIMQNPGSYWYPLLNTMVEKLTARNEATVQVKARNGYSGYMLLYAMTFPVVSANSINFAKPYGTGPYLIADYNAGNAVSLVLNANWWRIGTNQVPSIVGLCYRTATDALRGLGAGEIDTLASEYPTASVNRNLSDLISLDYGTNTYECIVPNLRYSILKSRAVREAIMYAVDRITLANTIYTGMVQESEVPVVPGSWLYEPQAARYSYNPERAYQILLDAGWTDPDNDGILQNEIDGVITNLDLQLITYDKGTTSTRSEAAEAIAAQLRLVGFNVSVVKVSQKNALSAMDEGKFQLALVAFELSDIPNLAFMLSQDGKSNFMRYKNDDMEKLLRQAYNARDEEELREAMSRIQLKIVDDLPLFGLFFRTGILTSSKPIRGLTGLRRGYVFDGIATGD